MISDVALIPFSQFNQERTDPSFQSSLKTILFYKKSLKPIKTGFEWASYLHLDAEALENLSVGQKKMDSITTPFILPSIIFRSGKLCQHFYNLFESSSKRSMAERVQTVVHDATTEVGQVTKATLWINKNISSIGREGLSFPALNAIGYLGCIAALFSDLFQLGKDVKKYYILSQRESKNLEDEQKLEGKKNYRAFRIAQDVGNFALSLLVAIGLFFQLLFSSLMVLIITTVVLFIGMAKFFFFEDKLMDKISEAALLNISWDFANKQKSFNWEETVFPISWY